MTFSDHENWVRCVRVHSSGAFVLSCSDDRSIRVLDVAKVLLVEPTAPTILHYPHPHSI